MSLSGVPSTTSSFCSTPPPLTPSSLLLTGISRPKSATPRLGGQSSSGRHHAVHISRRIKRAEGKHVARVVWSVGNFRVPHPFQPLFWMGPSFRRSAFHVSSQWQCPSVALLCHFVSVCFVQRTQGQALQERTPESGGELGRRAQQTHSCERAGGNARKPAESGHQSGASSWTCAMESSTHCSCTCVVRGRVTFTQPDTASLARGACQFVFICVVHCRFRCSRPVPLFHCQDAPHLFFVSLSVFFKTWWLTASVSKRHRNLSMFQTAHLPATNETNTECKFQYHRIGVRCVRRNLRRCDRLLYVMTHRSFPVDIHRILVHVHGEGAVAHGQRSERRSTEGVKPTAHFSQIRARSV